MASQRPAAFAGRQRGGGGDREQQQAHAGSHWESAQHRASPAGRQLSGGGAPAGRAPARTTTRLIAPQRPPARCRWVARRRTGRTQVAAAVRQPSHDAHALHATGPSLRRGGRRPAQRGDHSAARCTEPGVDGMRQPGHRAVVGVELEPRSLRLHRAAAAPGRAIPARWRRAVPARPWRPRISAITCSPGWACGSGCSGPWLMRPALDGERPRLQRGGCAGRSARGGCVDVQRVGCRRLHRLRRDVG